MLLLTVHVRCRHIPPPPQGTFVRRFLFFLFSIIFCFSFVFFVEARKTVGADI